MFSTLAFFKLLFSEEVRIVPPSQYIRIIDDGSIRITDDDSIRIVVE